MHYAKHGADISATKEALLDEAVNAAAAVAAADRPADALYAAAVDTPGLEAAALGNAHDAAQEQPYEMQAALPLSSQPANTCAGSAHPDVDSSAQQQSAFPARSSPETSPGIGTRHGPATRLGRPHHSCHSSMPVPDCNATALVCTEQLSVSPAEQQRAASPSAQQLRPAPVALPTRVMSRQNTSKGEQRTGSAACHHLSPQQLCQPRAGAGALPLQPALCSNVVPAEHAHGLSESAAQLQLAASSAAGLFSTHDASCADQPAAVTANGQTLPWVSHVPSPFTGELYFTAGALLMAVTLLVTQLGIHSLTSVQLQQDGPSQPSHADDARQADRAR